ncbi:MAG: M20/M25/M40 family metallo-hydrolase [Candidatus Bathyarchaeota archaeon]|jgi:acetylornithine deacetylase|nr:M20/M25/M40 family metallo-hydrolase [Candidatus Bathyarchaeota archaeon]
METHITEIKPGRVNAVGVLKAEGEGPVLMLNGHTDTVGIEYMEIDPLDPVIKEGRLYGRGTNDMKGGLAAILTATKALVNSGKEFRGDLIVAAVCDEEFASIGTEALMKEVDIDAVIVCEPTEFQILVAHKGFAWIDIETRGISAHGSAWQIGVDAIAKMGKVQVGLDSFQEESLMKRSHRLVGPPLSPLLYHRRGKRVKHLSRSLQSQSREKTHPWGDKGRCRNRAGKPFDFYQRYRSKV